MTTDRLCRKTVSLDCDTLYFSNVLASFRDLPSGVSSSFYFKDEGDKPVFSYLELDGEGMVKDIREKVPISRNANTGGYAFATGLLLRKYCMQVLDEAVGTAGEFYTSCVIKKMLDDGHKFKGLFVEDFACVGTPWQLTSFLQKIARNEVKSARKMRFVFDLDNTLVTHPKVHGDYSTCEPKERNVQLVQELSAAGHYIIIWTARRMRTHKANVGAVIKDVGLITLQSLAKCGIPYDELHFGKPNADLYVDDLAVNALVDTEKEIGWACKTEAAPLPGMIAARSFNNVVVVDGTVIKSSKRDTISGEVFYYRSLPPSLTHLFPKVLSIEDSGSTEVSSISMERVKGVPLSHLMVSQALTPGRLLKFLAALELLHEAGSLSQEAAVAAGLNIYSNYAVKVQERYLKNEGVYKQFSDAEYLCNFIVAHLREYEAQGKGVIAKYIHGDPVFSNILMTSSNETYFIDMRGRVGDVHTTSGDVLYDLGKVYQSLYGYDFILLNGGGGGGTNRVQEDYLRTLRNTFRTFLKTSAFYAPILATRARDLEIITASLYFSLIPLHTNDSRIAAYIEKVKSLVFSGEEAMVET